MTTKVASPVYAKTGDLGEVELSSGSGTDPFDDVPLIDVEALAAGDNELAAVEAEAVQDRGVDVGDVVRMFDGVEAEFVGRAMDGARLDPRASEPDCEAVRVVVAAGRHLVGVDRKSVV